MSEGSVLAHVTEANDEADKGDAPLSEQNGALPRTPPKELSSFGILQYGAFFVVRRVLVTIVFWKTGDLFPQLTVLPCC